MTSHTFSKSWNVPEIEHEYPLTWYGASKRHSDFVPLRDSTDEKWTKLYSHRKELMSKGGTFIFCGDRGRGKTQMAVSIMGYFHKVLRQTVRYCTAHDAMKSITSRFSITSDTKTTLDFESPKLLILDACEVIKGSDFEIRELNSIIDKRYGEPVLSTIIITNDLPERIGEMLGESVVDRANETGGVFVFTGDSYRCKK